ncbi:hypothetical protein [Ammoniphilus sp. YIM 78166]|uniref:hypothetical protein n=1 Tax=Ammoniphilus sp. YIM 78166 TaxID=1644106 RepID=UPI00106FE430|nr:hypothetical protein [Ammoniphilus sp. YIM 78166]
MKTLIRGATLIYAGGPKVEDVLIHSGKIQEIRSGIRPMGGERQIDGSSQYVLPGFISEEGTLAQGVTTKIKKIHWSETADLGDWNQNQGEECTDYVFRVSLASLTKELLERLDQNRVKVLRVEQKLDWRIWEERIQRAGIVLELEADEYRSLAGLSIPFIVPYGRIKKVGRSRTIIKVTDEGRLAWAKQMKKLDPLDMRSYWLEEQETILPKLVKEEEIVRYLSILAHIRSRVPAKVFGVFPMKGSLHVGADADLVLLERSQLVDQAGAALVPRVMRKGEWIESGERAGKSQFLSANRTYAYGF